MKRLIIGIVILIVLLVGGLAAAIITLNSIDWSRYEEPIANAVKDATGRELHFSGALNVNIGLSPGISAAGITLQNADWASREQMLKLEHAEVQLKLLPLIFGRIELHQLEITGFDLLLETDQHGKGNWEFDLAGAESSDDADIEPESASGDESLLTAAFLKKAVIQNATIVYNDGPTGTSQRFSIGKLVAQMASPTAPLFVDLAASYGDEPFELAGEIDGIAGVLAGESLNLDVTLSAVGATVMIKGVVGKPLEADGIEIAIQASGDSLAALSTLAGTEVPDPGAYAIKANVAGTAEKFSLANLSIVIADMRIDGDLKADIAREPLRLEINLNSPKIDLTRFLPVEPSAADVAGTGKLPAGSNVRLFPDDPLPLDALEALDTIDAVVKLEIDELIVDPETTLINLDVGLQAAAKKISITPLKFTVMGATIEGRAGLEVVKKAAAVTVKLNINHPSVGDLVKDDSSTMLQGGPLNLDLDVTGSGASIRDIMASLNGSLVAELGAARASSKWMQQALAQATAIMTKSAPQRGATKPIDLHCVVTDFWITNGVAKTDSFIVDARKIALFGDGRIDLRDESLHLDFEWLAARVRTRNALPPFKVRGTLASPSSRIDTKGLLVDALGLGTGSTTEIDFEPAELTAASGPPRCRQRLVAYQQIREDRARPKEITVESVIKDVESTKDALRKLGGFFKKKKR